MSKELQEVLDEIDNLRTQFTTKEFEEVTKSLDYCTDRVNKVRDKLISTEKDSEVSRSDCDGFTAQATRKPTGFMSYENTLAASLHDSDTYYNLPNNGAGSPPSNGMYRPSNASDFMNPTQSDRETRGFM